MTDFHPVHSKHKLILCNKLSHEHQTSELINKHCVNNLRQHLPSAHPILGETAEVTEVCQHPGRRLACYFVRITSSSDSNPLASFPRSQIKLPCSRFLGSVRPRSCHKMCSVFPRCHASSRPSSLFTSGAGFPPTCRCSHSRICQCRSSSSPSLTEPL